MVWLVTIKGVIEKQEQKEQENGTLEDKQNTGGQTEQQTGKTDELRKQETKHKLLASLVDIQTPDPTPDSGLKSEH